MAVRLTPSRPPSRPESARPRARRPDSARSPRTRLQIRPRRPESARPPSPRQEAKRIFGKPEWSASHHVGNSKANGRLPRNCRGYFDELHAIHFKAGELVDVRGYTPELGPKDGSDVKRRLLRLPHYLREPRNAPYPILALSVATRGLEKPEPVYKIADSALDSALEAKEAAAADGGAEQAATAEEAAAQRPVRPTTPSSEKRKFDVGACKERMEGSEKYRMLVEWCEKKRMHMFKLFTRIDKNHNMSISQREFAVTMKELRYPHDIDQLWFALDEDTTGTLSLLEFMPSESLDLACFRTWAIDTFGNFERMCTVLDKDKNSKVEWPEFNRYLTEDGMAARLRGSVVSLYRLLSYDGVPTYKSLRRIELWKPPEFLWVDPDMQARESFEREMLRRYKNPILAWRKALDADSSMRVNFDEFLAACRKLSRDGNFKSVPTTTRGIGCIYCAYDKVRKGWFTFRDFAPVAHDLLVRFQSWVLTTDRVSNWIRSHEELPNDGMTFVKFRHEVKPLKLTSEELELLFEGLSMTKITHTYAGTQAGRISANEAIFLDQWRPTQDE